MNNDVSSPTKSPLPIAGMSTKWQTWWFELEPQWRAAFQLAFFRHAQQPTDEELKSLWQTPVLRLAGPKAFHPNLDFELTNCSGLKGMSNLEILVLTDHQIETVRELADLPHLKSLFVNNNAIRSLEGIEGLKRLEQIYAQANQIESLEPIRSLTQLREVYASFNALTSLNGLTRKHAHSLKAFVCLPNEQLRDREIIRTERNLGIRCRSL